MNILALDLGTTTGLAINVDYDFQAWSQTLATPKEITAFRKKRMDRRQDPRVLRFFDTLRGMHNTPGIVVFEDVQFQSYTLQTQLWSSFRAAVWLAFPNAIIDCVPTGTLKKFATGHGGATKEMMSAHLKQQYSAHWKPEYDDNAIDAIWLWLWAKKNLSRIDTGSR